MTCFAGFHAHIFHWIESHPVLAILTILVIVYNVHTWLYPDPIMRLPCPRGGSLFGGHLHDTCNTGRSPFFHQRCIRELGRNIRIRGLFPWEQRLLPMDPVTLAHVMKNTSIYEKPYTSRRFIQGIIGSGMLATEGHVHKRQRRVATPAFSKQNMRALVPVVFNKGEELKDRWMGLIQAQSDNKTSIRLDVCHWVSRATFDVIGMSGFEYSFNAIQNEENELFNAYRDMFEIAISQPRMFRNLLSTHVPIYDRLFPDKSVRAVRKGREVIDRMARQIIQEKKELIRQGEETGRKFEGRDLLSLLLKSNAATDLPPEQRISDEDIFHNINTFMFVGTDSTSLGITWTLLYLAKYPLIQNQLRAELRSMPQPENLGDEAVSAHYQILAEAPLLDKVCRESLRLAPPLHSSLRVTMQDDVLPASKGENIHIRKGTLVHVPVEAINLDHEIWGEDAWNFSPDRWDNLPESVTSLPSVFAYANMMSFSAGPRSCIGQRFALIEMKTFLYILITNFVFSETEEKIVKSNVVLTRPYLSGKFKEGTQCPLIVAPYIPEDAM